MGGTDEGLGRDIFGIDVRSVDRQNSMLLRKEWTSKTGLTAGCAEIEVGVQGRIGREGCVRQIIGSVDGVSIVGIDLQG